MNFKVKPAITPDEKVAYYNLCTGEYDQPVVSIHPNEYVNFDIEDARILARNLSKVPEMLEFINHVANTMPEVSSLQVKAKKLLNNYNEKL